MKRIVAAASRYRSEHDGIESWHCFSAGAHYEPDNVSFGPIVGVDEHLVAPGAGFDWHAHRGVHIVSWVLEGTLRHEDSHGDVQFLEPGALLIQSTGAGVRHTETNASGTDPLRFVQTTLVGAGTAGTTVRRPPVRIDAVTIEEARGRISVGGDTNAHVLVLAGRYDLDGHPLEAGDTVRVDDGDLAMIDGTGELLVAIIDQTNGERSAHS